MNRHSVTFARPHSPAPPAAAVLLLMALLLPAAISEAASLYSHLWGGSATSLAGRSPQQRGNAARAALDLDGAIIPSGEVFSFNQRVGGRDTLKGYLPAPIINDRGGVSSTPGGGICQLATTIYNAALEAGMEIVERHPHSRSVGYVAPGRDATILTWRKDLKLRNPHGVPLTLKVTVGAERLTAGFWSVEERPFSVRIVSDILPVEPEAVVGGTGVRPGALLQAGGRGYSVITRRSIKRDGTATEEILSRDFYPPPSTILAGDGL